MPLEQRVETWLEIVPAVLEELKIKHVALMSHSAGTIYAFNTAVKLPHLMYPGGKGFMGCLGEFSALVCFLISSPNLLLYASPTRRDGEVLTTHSTLGSP